jgi:hypothetical protein
MPVLALLSVEQSNFGDYGVMPQEMNVAFLDNNEPKLKA